MFTGAPLPPRSECSREQNTNLLVSTPGRLLDLHAKGCLDFADVEVLVLDEADRMVALGLAPDLSKLAQAPARDAPDAAVHADHAARAEPARQGGAGRAVRVDIAPPAKPAAGITQAIYPVPRDLKPALLDEMLARAEVRNTIVLTRSRNGADRTAKLLQRRGYAVAVLDEHLSQDERDRALEEMRRGRVQILVASEAAARSLEVAGTAHIVNYDVPQTPEDYVHRLGRGGRADPVGDAFTLMSPDEQKEVAAIESFLGRAIPRVMLPDFDYDLHPSQIKQAASYEESEDHVAARRAGGVATAAGRIATVRRSVGSNGPAPAPRTTRRHGPPARRPRRASRPARPHVLVAPSRPCARDAPRDQAEARPLRPTAPRSSRSTPRARPDVGGRDLDEIRTAAALPAGALEQLGQEPAKIGPGALRARREQRGLGSAGAPRPTALRPRGT